MEAANQNMRKIIILIIVIVVIVLLGIGAYFLFHGSSPSSDVTGQTGTLPNPITSTSTASNIFGPTPTGPYLSIGTARGTVQVNNFYLSNPAVDDGGDIIIKQAQNYVIVYDPSDSSFWLGVTGNPFSVSKSAVENDFLAVLGVSKADACKLSVTSGVIYSEGNPNDGKSFPLSFCVGGAFQTK